MTLTKHFFRNIVRQNQVTVRGSDNVVDIDDSVWRSMKKCKITVAGNNNRLIIGKNTRISHTAIRLKGNNNTIVIGQNVHYRKGKIYTCIGENETISIGDDTTVEGAYLLCDHECSITIGNDCMFSTDIMIRTGDKHPLYDLENDDLLNKPQNVTIEDRVWLAREVMVLKGCHIKKGSVAGAKSLVARIRHEENSVLAGVPAKVVKTGIRWER